MRASPVPRASCSCSRSCSRSCSLPPSLSRARSLSLSRPTPLQARENAVISVAFPPPRRKYPPARLRAYLALCAPLFDDNRRAERCRRVPACPLSPRFPASPSVSSVSSVSSNSSNTSDSSGLRMFPPYHSKPPLAAPPRKRKHERKHECKQGPHSPRASALLMSEAGRPRCASVLEADFVEASWRRGVLVAGFRDAMLCYAMGRVLICLRGSCLGLEERCVRLYVCMYVWSGLICSVHVHGPLRDHSIVGRTSQPASQPASSISRSVGPSVFWWVLASVLLRSIAQLAPHPAQSRFAFRPGSPGS